MYEKEEKKLINHKNKVNNVDIPLESLNQAIMSGFHKAKLEETRKPRTKKWMLSFVAAAIIFVGFFTSVRLSPAFADYITVIPGMEKVVELIRNDKGKMQAIESDYYEELNVSQEKNGLTFTVDGAIADEDSLVLFYSIESKEKQKELVVEEMHLESSDGEKLDLGSFSFGGQLTSDEGETFYNDMFEYHFQSPLEARSFELKVKVKGDHKTEEYLIHFQLKKDIQKKKTNALNKSITIEEQKITFLSADIYPLRIAVHVKMDSSNTMKLLEFQDLRLVDENGETWNKIANGVTASKLSDDESIIYLQSNYFNEPKELYLVFNEIQAVDKEAANIVIDTQKKQILKQPTGNQLSDLVINGDQIIFKLQTVDEFNYHPFSTVKDKNGNVLESPETSMSYHDGSTEIGVRIPGLTDKMSPISLELSFYPAWIEGDGRIQIK